MVANMEKGWFSVPGIRECADRTVEEQMLGLDRALAECPGKTVLDLGCAEGAIGLAFARAGAKRVLGIEWLGPHLDVARKLCKGQENIQFIQANLWDWMQENPEPELFDIGLCLGIAHKMREPDPFVRWSARAVADLFCFRAPAKVDNDGGDYVIRSKHFNGRCNVPKAMRESGFVDEGTVAGVRGEGVQYWRRRRQL